MDENLKKFLNRDLLPNDPESLKDLIISIVSMCLDQMKQTQDLLKQNQVLLENAEYLKSEISILKTFQYGQRSERLKKKR